MASELKLVKVLLRAGIIDSFKHVKVRGLSAQRVDDFLVLGY